MYNTCSYAHHNDFLQTLVYYNSLAGSMQKLNGAQSKIEKIEM